MKTTMNYTLLAILMISVIGYCLFSVLGGVREVLIEVSRALGAI